MSRFRLHRAIVALGIVVLTSGAALADDKKDCEGSDPDKGIAGCTRLIRSGQLRGAKLAEAHLFRGISYRDKRDYKAAKQDFDRAIALEPGKANHWTHRGWNFVEQRQIEPALADFDKAIALDSKHDESHRGRGWALAWRNDADGAIAAYDKAIASNDRNALAYGNRATTFATKGLHHKSLADAEKAVALDAKSTWLLSVRSDAYANLEQYQPALADADRMIALEPDNPDGYAQRASVFSSMRETARALGEYNRALSLAPRNVAALNGRAWSLHLLGENERAVSVASEALAIEALPEIQDTRGWGYLGLKKYSEALADFDNALKGKGSAGLMTSKVGRGVALVGLGQSEKALAELEQATAMAPRVADERYAMEVALKTIADLRKSGIKAATSDQTSGQGQAKQQQVAAQPAVGWTHEEDGQRCFAKLQASGHALSLIKLDDGGIALLLSGDDWTFTPETAPRRVSIATDGGEATDLSSVIAVVRRSDGRQDRGDLLYVLRGLSPLDALLKGRRRLVATADGNAVAYALEGIDRALDRLRECVRPASQSTTSAAPPRISPGTSGGSLWELKR